jgi:uncharacterized NAD(P)/FAD-binding protein YdhS
MSDGVGPNSGAPAADPRETVAIIGGGFTGAVVAHQIARRAPGRFRIVVIEPRPTLGAGVAYSTPDPAHRVNVPASRMSFVPSDPCHFDRWLKADGELMRDPDATTPDGRAFPRRAAFGRYVAETLDPHLLSGEIEHRRGRAETVIPTGLTGFQVDIDGGETLAAPYVVLATTHPPPSPPAALAALRGDPRLIADTQDPQGLDALSPTASVLIVGTGLTMADIVASLDRRGHRGRITAISRRGLLSRGHTETAGEFGSFAIEPGCSAVELLRRIRAAVTLAGASGVPWQHVIDAVRNQGRNIWSALAPKQRRIVVRRLRAFWDVHRFRIAPQIDAQIARLQAEERLTLLAAEAVGADGRPDAVSIKLRLKGGALETRDYDAVALATGPAHSTLCETDPLVRGLAEQGLVRPDPVGLGLETDPSSVAVGSNGRPTRSFWIAGPLARGTFGELMGLPEVARHAEFVAHRVLSSENRRQTDREPELELA